MGGGGESKFEYEGNIKTIDLKTEYNNTGFAYVFTYSVLDCSDRFGLRKATQIKNQKFLFSARGDESTRL